MLERVGRVEAESSEAEFPASRRGRVVAAAEELLSGDGGAGHVLGDPTRGLGKRVFGNWESDATRILVGVRQGRVTARVFKAWLRPSLKLPFTRSQLDSLSSALELGKLHLDFSLRN